MAPITGPDAGAADRPEIHIEQRRSPRAPLSVQVQYSTVDSLFEDFTRNVNEGGLFIATREPCAVDTLVSLQFTLPGMDEPVRTLGRVVWVDEDGMGIEFEELDAAARARINQIVRRLRKA